MSTLLAAGSGSDDADERAEVARLVQESGALSPRAREDLLQRLTVRYRVLSLDHADALAPAAGCHADKLNALRQLAAKLGHPPTTTEYHAARDASGKAMPSVSAIVKAFDGWPKALIAAGLVPDAPASAYLQRADYLRKQAHLYAPERLDECLQACARHYGRVPMVRDFVAWRNEMLADVTCDRDSIPHWRTYYNHFGSWAAALAHAGLPSARRARTGTPRFDALPARAGKPDARTRARSLLTGARSAHVPDEKQRRPSRRVPSDGARPGV